MLMYNLELAMSILPELDEETSITEIEHAKVSLRIAEALDLTVKSGANSIVFTPWPIASPYPAAEITQLAFLIGFARVHTLKRFRKLQSQHFNAIFMFR